MDPSKSESDGNAGADPVKSGSETPTKAFECWLDSQLKALYQPLAEEPVPPEMIELIRAMKKVKKS